MMRPDHKYMCDVCYEGMLREIGEFETCTVPSLRIKKCDICGVSTANHCGNPPADYVTRYRAVMERIDIADGGGVVTVDATTGPLDTD